ncbi:MAG: hypothetical protein P4L92_12510 [Rudaea sp.]|nr:hypothetical protein [Rudaea sp.]
MKAISMFIAFFCFAVAQVAVADTAATVIVIQDQVALRAAARDSAQQQAVLWQGDVLEVRGRRLDFLQVYDHRRERAGYIRVSQVRGLPLDAGSAADLLAVVRFLRDTPGAEALGIGYAAAYLKAAPAAAIGAEPFDALGMMAERLARRASLRHAKTDDAVISAHLEVAANYGVVIRSFERDGRMQLCYDGEAFRRVLAMKSSDVEKARAALALTRQECIDPDLTPINRASLDQWRADVLERAPRMNLPEHIKNRLRLRSAEIWSSIAFERARRGEPAQEAATLAIEELASVSKIDLAEDDAAAYGEAATRVGASRWAAEPARAAATGLSIVAGPGQPGETCVKLIDGKHDQSTPLAQRCTFAIVWTSSVARNAQGTALALAVQPLEGWRELWLFHQASDGWHIDIVPPADGTPDLGYVEFAGWVPGAAKLLVAREARVNGRMARSFDILNMRTLDVEKHADNPASLSLFYRWQDPAWKRQTVSVR